MTCVKLTLYLHIFTSVDAQISISAEDEDASDVVWVNRFGFLEPTSQHRGSIVDGKLETEQLNALPTQYNAEGLVVSQSEVRFSFVIVGCAFLLFIFVSCFGLIAFYCSSMWL